MKKEWFEMVQNVDDHHYKNPDFDQGHHQNNDVELLMHYIAFITII